MSHKTRRERMATECWCGLILFRFDRGHQSFHDYRYIGQVFDAQVIPNGPGDLLLQVVGNILYPRLYSQLQPNLDMNITFGLSKIASGPAHFHESFTGALDYFLNGYS